MHKHLAQCLCRVKGEVCKSSGGSKQDTQVWMHEMLQAETYCKMAIERTVHTLHWTFEVSDWINLVTSFPS